MDKYFIKGVLAIIFILAVLGGALALDIYQPAPEPSENEFFFTVTVYCRGPDYYEEPYYELIGLDPTEVGIYRYSQHPIFFYMWEYEKIGSIVISIIPQAVGPRFEVSGSAESLENLCVGYPDVFLHPDALKNVAVITENNQHVEVYYWRYIGALPIG